MTTRLYAVFGALVLGALLWVHYTGWAPSAAITEEKAVPKSVRESPGSARSSYRTSTGAK